MTRSDFDEICLATCPYCANNTKLRQRLDTAEWVHDERKGTAVLHTICFASGFRNSRFAKELTDG